jgi:DNA-binding MurR/RpiR family transcriptional regulator
MPEAAAALTPFSWLNTLQPYLLSAGAGMTILGDPFEVLKSYFQDLPYAQQRVARMLLDEPAQVALLSTAALGQRVGVSDSTVVRLASAIGYAGYPELRAAIHETLFSHIAPSEQFRRSLSEDRESATQASIRVDALNLGQLNADSVQGAVLRAASAIAAASSVHVAGSQSSFAPAYELSYMLGRVRPDVHLVTAGSGDFARQLQGIQVESVVVVFSVPRYSRDTYTVAKYAEDVGATVVAVTDSLTAPVAQLKSLAITAPCSSASFFQSQVASMSIANAIASEVAKQKSADAEHRLQALESLDEAFGRFLIGREQTGSPSAPISPPEHKARRLTSR